MVDFLRRRGVQRVSSLRRRGRWLWRRRHRPLTQHLRTKRLRAPGGSRGSSLHRVRRRLPIRSARRTERQVAVDAIQSVSRGRAAHRPSYHHLPVSASCVCTSSGMNLGFRTVASSINTGQHPVILETRDQLTALEQKLVHKAWSRASQTLVLAHVRDVGIRLRGLDLQRLRHPNWLHDEIVNAYMGILNRRYRQHGVYCFNSFFYTRLVNPSYRFEFVRRWTTRAGLCIQRDSLLLIPVNLDQRHWILVAIDAAHRELRCYDSMHTRDGWRVLPNLKQWLLDELADKQIQDPWLLRDDWRAVLTHEVQTLPRQRDRGSCGVFSLLFAEALASSWSAKHADSRSQSKSNCCRFPFDQHDIPLLRMRIVLALLQQCPEM